MRRFALAILIMNLTVLAGSSLASGQGAGGEASKSSKGDALRAPTDFERAQQAWPQFFTRFRKAVRTRDLKTLGEMMSDDFEYPCALEGGRAPYGEGREFGLRKFRDSGCSGGWMTLERIMKRGVTTLLPRGRIVGCVGEIRTISRMLPGNWLSSKSEVEVDYALFEFGPRRWALSRLSHCDSE